MMELASHGLGEGECRAKTFVSVRVRRTCGAPSAGDGALTGQKCKWLPQLDFRFDVLVFGVRKNDRMT